MNEIKFLHFNQVNPEDLMKVVNENSLRTHLIDHPYFDTDSLQTWIEDKIKVDSISGCRVRVISIDGEIAGWCGIQPDDNGFEIAIVISQRFWGTGVSLFKTLLGWAREFGHKEILFHLLESRPEYKVLNKMSTRVHKTDQLGRRFTTYHISVSQ